MVMMMINGDDDEGDKGSDTVTVDPERVELQYSLPQK